MNTDPLAPGTLLAPSGATATATHYRIGRVLGTGGFGITYLAEWMGAEVAIKEYLPSDFAARSHGGLSRHAPASKASCSTSAWNASRRRHAPCCN